MLRYAGGKTRAIKVLTSLLPPDLTELVSPFLGGGSLELALVSKGVRVIGSDIVSSLVSFWRCMKECRDDLIHRLLCELPATKDTYKVYQRTLNEGTDLDKAVKFFVVNRCCFSGCITGGYSGTRFTRRSIDALRSVNLSTLTIDEGDYETQLARHPDTFAFLDPPYDVPNLYGSSQFNHERLAEVLRHRTAPWLLCYNDTPRIRELYDGCEILSVSWSYGMNASKKSNEIIIVPAFKTNRDSPAT